MSTLETLEQEELRLSQTDKKLNRFAVIMAGLLSAFALLEAYGAFHIWHTWTLY